MTAAGIHTNYKFETSSNEFELSSQVVPVPAASELLVLLLCLILTLQTLLATIGLFSIMCMRLCCTVSATTDVIGSGSIMATTIRKDLKTTHSVYESY